MSNLDCRTLNGKLSSPSRARRKAVWGARAAAVALATLLPSSCSDAIRSGSSPAYLVMNSIEGAKGGGANSGSFGTSLSSDVVTLVPAKTGTATIFTDNGQAQMQLQMRDVLDSPSTVNAITLTQYHVKYTRSDGHNVQGVDVPFEFDGGLGFTIGSGGTVGGTVAFTLVRAQAKQEAPLAALANNGQIISTIAEVTFYGHDQNGNAVTVTGRINVDFSNWGD